jgi:ATP-dependent DNA helicase UvrD/PcrA
VLIAVRALREDDDVRRRWQSRFQQVLVDEYQDIEPAQELLVRILAAPQDGFFCVGDEDQTLYGWRRASVRRILDLDAAYPGLQRISLAHNYRCPPEIVAASRSLIEHNRIRFPKPIAPDPQRSTGVGTPVALREHAGQAPAAGALAAELADAPRGEVVVLARTTNLLRTVALAFSELGVKIAAPEEVFEPHGARAAVEAYLRLCSNPKRARPDDVVAAFRMPSRGLPFESEERVAELLHEGLSFADAVAQLPATARQRARLTDAGTTLDVLRSMTRAADFIGYLRGPGGLDEYFAAHEKTFAGSEQIELEVLEQSQREAGRRTVAEYAGVLQELSDQLRSVCDDVNGLELTTIHRAKGRQWPVVHVFAVEEGQLPHSRALDVSPEERAAGEGLEAERRLTYVAFTRAQRALVIHASRDAPSRFLTDSGLAPSRPAPQPERPRRPRSDTAGSTRRAAGRDRPARPNRWTDAQAIPADVARVLTEAERVGLAYALRTAVTRRTALRGAATAVERRLAGPQTASTRLTVAELLAAIESLDDDQRSELLLRAELDGDRRVAQLGAGPRGRLAHVLRELASASAD